MKLKQLIPVFKNKENKVVESIKKKSSFYFYFNVDKVWKIFTKSVRGPFELMDIIGLDVVYDIEMSYFKKSGNLDDKPPQTLKDKIARGELGKKTGKGFYIYETQ